ncbi:MAG: hypothetical protein ACR2HJ_10580 [Fimbriimonadales bacterium]
MIEVGPPEILTNAFVTVFSADGRMAAGFEQLGPRRKKVSLKVWSCETLRVVYEHDFTESEFAYPVLLDATSKRLIYIYENHDNSTQLVSLDFERLAKTDLPVDMSELSAQGLFRNSDQSIVLLDGRDNGLLITRLGAVTLPQFSRKGFDMYGVFWAKTGNSWQYWAKDGASGISPTLKSSLVLDQTKIRGRLALSRTDATTARGEATAYVSAIWMEDPRTPDLESAPRAGLVDVCTDVFDYGFVPNKDRVWISATDGSTRLIPYYVTSRAVPSKQ